jgi:hypothetical protein
VVSPETDNPLSAVVAFGKEKTVVVGESVRVGVAPAASDDATIAPRGKTSRAAATPRRGSLGKRAARYEAAPTVRDRPFDTKTRARLSTEFFLFIRRLSTPDGPEIAIGV